MHTTGTRQGTSLKLLIEPDLIDGLDGYIHDHIHDRDDAPAIPRTEAVRAILHDWLTGHGYLPQPPAREDCELALARPARRQRDAQGGDSEV